MHLPMLGMIFPYLWLLRIIPYCKQVLRINAILDEDGVINSAQTLTGRTFKALNTESGPQMMHLFSSVEVKQYQLQLYMMQDFVVV